MTDVEKRLNEMGFSLPDPGPAVGNYVGAVHTGRLVFVSGHGPRQNGELIYTGKLGESVDVATGYKAAQLVMLNCLASLKQVTGSLDRVQQIVRVFGMVNSAPNFVEQPKVIDGASDLLTDLYAERGRHARCAVGMAALPFNISVEIEMIVEVAE